MPAHFIGFLTRMTGSFSRSTSPLDFFLFFRQGVGGGIMRSCLFLSIRSSALRKEKCIGCDTSLGPVGRDNLRNLDVIYTVNYRAVF